MQIEIKEMLELRVAAVRHVGPYDRIAQAFEQLGSVAGRAGLFARPGAAMLAIYYDVKETTPADQLRSDAAVTIPEDAPLPHGLTEQRLAGGRYASTLHVGAYEQLPDTWARFMREWLPSSGHRIGTGASYEIYRNTPADVPKADLRTELYIPLA